MTVTHGVSTAGASPLQSLPPQCLPPRSRALPQRSGLEEANEVKEVKEVPCDRRNWRNRLHRCLQHLNGRAGAISSSKIPLFDRLWVTGDPRAVVQPRGCRRLVGGTNGGPAEVTISERAANLEQQNVRRGHHSNTS
eukprot:GHVU01068712.1.p1 GENE.GHVU01068712.1~~GHVU01068712.1.p1  ORF type:complete len:137 (-),score=9.35 GHVU01068712.1:225-635(-)